MLFRNMQRKYFEQAGQDGTEGGGAADVPVESEKLFTQADLDAAIAGLKSKNDELLGEKKTASQKAKEAEEARIKAEQEAAKAREALREQVAALAVRGAEQILRREVNAGVHAELLTRLKTEL